MKFTLPALRAATPAMLGASLMVGPNGVMMGTRMVVSAEWVGMMRGRALRARRQRHRADSGWTGDGAGAR
ncbi:hypothetical protein ACN28E_37285 [Archangium lansingense]|uniref:hypothetical protein n=1 Tax=Archangium lansingense TaxID=2995310 RepID=UPI003B7931CB